MQILSLFLGDILETFLCILGSFLMVKVQNGVFFFEVARFQIFLGCLKFLIFFGGEG